MITTKNNLGLLHSYNDQPSLIDDLGNKYWHINGRLERPGDLPCLEFIDGDKRYSLENGCYKTIKQKSNIKIEEYYNSKNKRHRLDGPSYIEYYEKGNIKSEYYYVDGKQSRLDGPAEIWHYENGDSQYEAYYVDNKYSRLDGPAYVYYYENGNIQSEYYYINNELLTEQQFLKLSKTLQKNTI